MSINMTQAFEFETDDPKSFETMLQAIVPILFGKNGSHTKLHLQGSPEFWDDGREYEEAWNSCPRMYQEGDKVSLLKPSRIYGGAYLWEKVGEAPDLDAAAVQSMKHKKEPAPTRVWITTLQDYAGDYGEGDTYCNGHKDMVVKAMELVKNANLKKLQEECGDGYNDGFNHNDGSISVGYRMQYEPNGGWNQLVLSLIHIYYGK